MRLSNLINLELTRRWTATNPSSICARTTLRRTLSDYGAEVVYADDYSKEGS